MGEHRVPLLGSSWRRHEDPAASRDPRVRAVVGALTDLPQPEVRPEFRADLRAQLVAITPRIVAEGTTTPAGAVRSRPTPHGRAAATPTREIPRARHSDSVIDRLRRIHPRPIRWGRPLAVTASVLVAFAVLLGGAVVMSRKALPGDALYGLKRASEQFQLATAGSSTDKAKDYLDFAATRAREAQALAGRPGSALGGVHAGAAASGSTGKLIVSTLQSADADVRAAARLLGTDAVQHRSASPLTVMTGWAPGQEQRLQQLAAALGDPALRLRALSSAHLVQAAQARAAALSTEIGCSCLSTTNSDALGPRPCTACGPPAGHPAASPAPQPGTGARTHHAPGSGNGGGGGPAGVSTSAAPGPASQPGGSPSTTPPIGVPTLLPSSPSLPVTGSSCGASVSLPVLGGLGVGVCSGVNVQLGH